MNQWGVLWFAEINCIVHVIFQIHCKMTVEMATLRWRLEMMSATQTRSARIVRESAACNTAGSICYPTIAAACRLQMRVARFNAIHTSLPAEPMTICRQCFSATPEAQYRYQLVISSWKSSVGLIELAMEDNHLKKWTKKDRDGEISMIQPYQIGMVLVRI